MLWCTPRTTPPPRCGHSWPPSSSCWRWLVHQASQVVPTPALAQRNRGPRRCLASAPRVPPGMLGHGHALTRAPSSRPGSAPSRPSGGRPHRNAFGLCTGGDQVVHAVRVLLTVDLGGQNLHRSTTKPCSSKRRTPGVQRRAARERSDLPGVPTRRFRAGGSGSCRAFHPSDEPGPPATARLTPRTVWAPRNRCVSRQPTRSDRHRSRSSHHLACTCTLALRRLTHALLRRWHAGEHLLHVPPAALISHLAARPTDSTLAHDSLH